jgi:steroid 5-alpha reductase family enzyme
MAKLSKRIYILNGGRGPFLNFLRNLTPQLLLLTSSLLLAKSLDFTRFDWSNWSPTVAFFILLVGFLIAAWINSTDFLRDCLKPVEKWKRRLGRLLTNRQIEGRWPRFVARVAAILRKKKTETFEIFSIVFFLQAAFATVVAHAIIAAFAKH